MVLLFYDIIITFILLHLLFKFFRLSAVNSHSVYLIIHQVFDVIAAIMNFEVISRPANSCCPNGCLSIWCQECKKYQDDVLKQVSSVIDMIDSVENLFPSSTKMTMIYPAWADVEFVSRCRTLYLW